MTFSFMVPGSVGPITFGMERAKVRACLGGPFRSFKKTFLSTNTLDSFDSHGVHVYYCDNDRVKGIELFRDSEFTWAGERLLGENYIYLKGFLAVRGVGFSSNDSGVDVDAYGLSFYIPDVSDEGDGAIVESVYIDLSVGQTFAIQP